jgi:hypothetical protein
MILSLAVLGLGCALVMQSLGWAQTSYMAFSKALDHGTPQIDRWHWETRDKSYTDGHFYSVKAPGLPMMTLPLYALLHAVDAEKVAHDMRVTGAQGGKNPWAYRGLQIANYGNDRQRAIVTRAQIEDDAPMAWALVLLGALLPALALAALVGRAANRVAPGTGIATALAMAAGTMMLPFSTLLFSHVLSALLGFGAFWVAWNERRGGGDLWRIALAGGLAGLAVTTEYPLLIAAAIVGLYVLARSGATLLDTARRAVAYAAGALAGVAPLLLYNAWAFSNPLHMSYSDAVSQPGVTGHDTLGLNSGGVFGITWPRLHDGLSLLVGGRGLLTLTPVLVVAIAGVVAMRREGHKAEAWTIGALALAYLVYDAGYWLPFGGGSPGPRFLVPIIPFLCVGLGPAWWRWPAPTLALTAVGAAMMTIATITHPMISTDRPGDWWHRLADLGVLQHTLFDVTGIAHGNATLVPVVVLIAAGLALGVSTLGAAHLARGWGWGAAALGGWFAAAAVLPGPLGWAPCTKLIDICGTTSAAKGDEADLKLLLTCLAAGALALAWAWIAARLRREPVDDHAAAGLALDSQPIQTPA